MNNYHSGHFAEIIALWFLRLKGYRRVALNYRTGQGTRAGEVDLIVRRGKVLVFVEVKKRQTLDVAAYAVQPVQQQRIRRGAEAFLGAHPHFQSCDIRFDAVLIAFPWQIRHIKNAF